MKEAYDPGKMEVRWTFPDEASGLVAEVSRYNGGDYKVRIKRGRYSCNAVSIDELDTLTAILQAVRRTIKDEGVPT